MAYLVITNQIELSFFNIIIFLKYKAINKVNVKDLVVERIIYLVIAK